MLPNLTLAAVLAVEDDPGLLERRCASTGLLTWPLLRNQFLRALTSPLLYPGVQTIGPPPPGRYRRALSALPRTLWANAKRWNRLRGDILIMASGAGHFQRSSRSFNRITDYFAMESLERTVTLEGLMDWQVPVDRANENAGYFLPWQGRIDLLGKLHGAARHRREAAELVEFVRGRALDLLDLRIADSQAAYLTSMVAMKIARLPALQSTYRALLAKVRPRLVLLEQGCYSDLGVFNVVARQMGIRIAEPQHGLVSAGHDAYSYAATVRNSAEYRDYLPHDFLGYGAWWNEQINVPITKWVVGHPHYIEQRGAHASTGATRSAVVILSDGFDFEKYLELARDLASRIGPSHSVVLRPHPLERQRVWSRFDETSPGDVVIDRARDIYPTLASAFAVVGEISTGLFEAIGLAERIFLWATPKALYGCPQHPFVEFRDATELAERLRAPMAAAQPIQSERIWASDWRANYRRYLEIALGASHQGGPA
jgi:hypothetical protein